jgi:hypothetical protein
MTSYDEAPAVATVRGALRTGETLAVEQLAPRCGLLHPEAIAGIADHLVRMGHAHLVTSDPRQWRISYEGRCHLLGLTRPPRLPTRG